MDDRKMIKKYADYQKWVEKMEDKGIPMSNTAKMYSISFDRFKARYGDLQNEKKSFDGGIVEEMKRRSFKSGSVKQAESAYESVKETMRHLKYSKDAEEQALYKQLNEEFDFEGMDFDISTQLRTGEFFGSDEAKLNKMIKKFTGFGIAFNWNSPD